MVSDRVVASGGTTVISETTELYGAEHLLVRRSRSSEVARKLLDRIQWWKDYVAMYGGQIDNNPSVGNKAGGLTTITENHSAQSPRADPRRWKQSMSTPSGSNLRAWS